MADEDDKVRVSRKTAKKLASLGSDTPKGEELAEVLEKVVKKLKEGS
jgi:hypothetical protein